MLQGMKVIHFPKEPSQECGGFYLPEYFIIIDFSPKVSKKDEKTASSMNKLSTH